MKKIIIAILCCLCFFTPVFADQKQSDIQKHLWSIWEKSIPNKTVDEFNSRYGWSLEYGMTVKQAYDQGLLSDGNAGVLTNYAHSLIGSDSSGATNGNCNYDPNGGMSMSAALDNCLRDSTLKSGSGELQVEWGIKRLIITWTNAIAWFLGLIAVGAIVYWAFMLTVSGWNEENVKKWKDAILWAMVGFLALIAASALVRVVVELIYDLA